MRTMYALKIVFVFAILYAVTSPIRHPNFNSIWFVASLLLLVFLFAHVIQRTKGSVQASALCVAYGIIASSISYLLDWAMQGGNGISRYLKNFGAGDFFISLLTTPFFCYAALLLPLSYLILNQGHSWRNRAAKS